MDPAAPAAGTDTPPVIDGGETPGTVGTFPPYPPYVVDPSPPSVADTIRAGRNIRTEQKSVRPSIPVPTPPKPARPRGPKATDVKMTKRAARAHARCLRRYNAVLSDRMERMSKPPRRSIIYLWRERADMLPADTISRLRSMLDADEPFKPEQAYEYFINLKKAKRAKTGLKGLQAKKDVMALYGDKRFQWARNATVAFAKGIQQRLSRPGKYTLADGMLRLSNIILEDLCSHMRVRTPSRRSTNPKAKFMVEMADKVAVWIDEILAESDDRMLMMDFDEDEDVLGADEAGVDGFADDFLNMMAGGGLLKGPQPAYLKFTGDMLEAFLILTGAMNKKGDTNMLTYGKCSLTYAQGADELKQATDFEATDYNTAIAAQLKDDLAATAKPDTPAKIEAAMKEMVDICSKYLAQVAEYNKDKGPAFRLLVKQMRAKPNEQLYQKEKAKRTLGAAATELEKAKGLESDHDDPNLSQQIHSTLSNLVQSVTPDDLKEDMKETLDLCSKYLSQRAVDEIERGPAFDLLIETLEKNGGDPFTPDYPHIATKFTAAYVLKSAPGLSSVTPDTSTAPIFNAALHRAVDTVTPPTMVPDMKAVIDRCGNYLSAFNRDRDKAIQALLKMMKSNPTKSFAKRNNYDMTYGAGAAEVEQSPTIVPYCPIKDIADEGRKKLAADMENITPPELKMAVKSAVTDVAGFLSQAVALRSGVAGERYGLNLLTAITKSLGQRPLLKYKSYGQTYNDGAEVLKYAGKLESDPNAGELSEKIANEMKLGGLPMRISPALLESLSKSINEAAQHLGKHAKEYGDALDYLVGLMKAQGNAPLAKIQGYEQTYMDAAIKIENATSLTNPKVDKGVYETVKVKLTKLVNDKPKKEYEGILPDIVDDCAKFLAAPMPETEAEKRQLLAELMARRGDDLLGQEGYYKMTFKEGGAELKDSPAGVTTAYDAGKLKEMQAKINSVVPDKALQAALQNSVNEGSAYLTDVIKGRGDAMQTIHDSLKKQGGQEFLNVGQFHKTYDGAAQMLENAKKFGGQNPSPVLKQAVGGRIDKLDKSGATAMGKSHMSDTADIATNYIAGVATDTCGLDEKALAAMAGKLGAGGVGAGAGGVGAGAGGVGAGAGAGAGGAGAAGAGGAAGGVGAGGVGAGGVGAGGVGAGGAGAGGVGTGGAGAGGAGAGAGGGAGFGAGFGAGAAGAGSRTGFGTETEEERRRREEEERRRAASLKGRGEAGVGSSTAFDQEREQALQILHRQLNAKSGDILYKQPHTVLTNGLASEWLKKGMKVEKTVKESGDTQRLSKKLERKLGALVAPVTPADMYDVMQDVIIESSRTIAEYFVSANYKALSRDAVIAEMQKRGNEILIELDRKTETYFFAAQRLKKTNTLEAKEPCDEVSYYLTKKLEEMIRCRTMPRKLFPTLKEYIKDVAAYLSEQVTKPDPDIEAYCALVTEIEAAGDALLVEGRIPKSYKDAATYLKKLTSYDDKINKGDSSVKSAISSKLNALMTNVPPGGYQSSNLSKAVDTTAQLLASYIGLQGEKTDAMQVLIKELENAGQAVLLRHGNLRKSHLDGAELLLGKTADELGVTHVDPVVARKIQIKLHKLMSGNTDAKFQALKDDIIDETTDYLAVHLLQPRVIAVCKCMKNVFVQCELWCDEILRRVGRPCCPCSRHLSTPTVTESGAGGLYSHMEAKLTQCPAWLGRSPCPAPRPQPDCDRHVAYMYATERIYPNQARPLRLDSERDDSQSSPGYETSEDLQAEQSSGPLPTSSRLLSPSPLTSASPAQSHSPPRSPSPSPSPGTERRPSVSWRSPDILYSSVSGSSSLMSPMALPRELSRTFSPTKSCSNRTPIISTDQMGDWQAMMVSLLWNMQAWRDWIQENIDYALSRQPSSDVIMRESNDSWNIFQRRVATEALQWRQYSIFSRQLALRLSLRYRDKQIVSPTRATDKTKTYMECQRDMLEIINMFNKWTQWLTAVIKETNSLQPNPGSGSPLQELYWSHFNIKVQEYAGDWLKYNMHLKLCWEQKFTSLTTDWLPTWKERGPVWVVSACGAVPSGAVAAGRYADEIIWIARTTHRCNVLPAALHPSKHCCIVYADGAVHHYTKYQVMCNAEAQWVAWRAGGVTSRAVRVAAGVHIGRVLYRRDHLIGPVHHPHYRCHVVIFGRPFAFNCYELLVLNGED